MEASRNLSTSVAACREVERGFFIAGPASSAEDRGRVPEPDATAIDDCARVPRNCMFGMESSGCMYESFVALRGDMCQEKSQNNNA